MQRKYLSFLKTHGPFIALFIVVLALRTLILIDGKVPIDDSDAQHGLMAKHIYEHKIFYLYEINEPIHGGAALEAMVAALCFWITGGVSDRALQASPLIFSMLALISFYFLSFKWFGKFAAIIASLIWAFATPMTYWNFKLYAGYLEIIPLISWILFVEDKIIFDSRQAWGQYLLLGILFGFGLWTLEIMIPFLAAFLLLWVFRVNTKRWIMWSLFLGVGFIIGYLPSIIYNSTHNYANWAFIFSGRKFTFVSSFIEIVRNNGVLSIVFMPFYILRFLFTDLKLISFIPRFFEPDNEWSMTRDVSIISWIQMSVVISIVAYWIALTHKQFILIFISLFKKTNIHSSHLRKDQRIFLINFSLFVFAIFYIVNPFGYRFLVPVYPCIALIIALIINIFYNKGVFSKMAGQGMIMLFIIFAIWGYHLVFTKDRKYSQLDFYSEKGRIQNIFVETSDDAIKEVIIFLSQMNIHDLYAPYLTTFLFQYLSRERIDAASFLPFLADRYPEKSENVRRAKRFAVVVYWSNPYVQRIYQELTHKEIPYRSKIIDEFLVFYPWDTAP